MNNNFGAAKTDKNIDTTRLYETHRIKAEINIKHSLDVAVEFCLYFGLYFSLFLYAADFAI